MTDVDAFSLFCISHGGKILAVTLLTAVTCVQGARHLRLFNKPPYKVEMVCRTFFNAMFFLVALVFFYQAMKIRALHTAFEELNSPYYQGGGPAFPVATRGELTALNNLSNRAMAYAILAVLTFLPGCGLQYRRARRHRRLVGNGSDDRLAATAVKD